jgi:TPP-dependent pyruvate/acetoin dehydrogenase alpha subunit
MSDDSGVNDNGEDTTAERAEVHRLAATLDELMRTLLAKGVLDRDALNAIETEVARRIDEAARLW